MPTIKIEGIGRVTVGNSFHALTPEQQNAYVGQIVAEIIAGRRSGGDLVTASSQPTGKMMPTFELTTPTGDKYEIEAPDEYAAAKALEDLIHRRQMASVVAVGLGPIVLATALACITGLVRRRIRVASAGQTPAPSREFLTLNGWQRLGVVLSTLWILGLGRSRTLCRQKRTNGARR